MASPGELKFIEELQVDIINTDVGKLKLAKLQETRTSIKGHLVLKKKLLRLTNFGISRYDVDRIMASSSLLSKEMAKQNKDMDSSNKIFDNNPSNYNHHLKVANASKEDNSNVPNWKMALYHKTGGVDDFRSGSYYIGVNGMIGIEAMN
ncbi:Hypothetical predicted protein [Olea europaea subsp. europaea]|uniref:Uncharacterized protein n=1 Tax=Olea europaea subsp. europaea TaxID=158383 RepID=A0A8S0T4F4_OLEEU|nr:Hypothetical predicted protein [Olea europaea subsp. europaea]